MRGKDYTMGPQEGPLFLSARLTASSIGRFLTCRSMDCVQLSCYGMRTRS
jgi:hypothetical protein